MDKKFKLKTELAKKLKKETSVTGTGASVTPGTGAGVATKYAFGKRDNKGTPSDWKSAPSIPNRKSKAMDYKELWEDDDNSYMISKAGKKDNPHYVLEKPDGSKQLDMSFSSPEEAKKYAEKKGIKISAQKGYNMEENTGTYDSLASILKQLGAEEDSIKVLIKAVEMGALKPSDAITIVKKALGVKEELQEGYAQFRNETKMRSKPDQFHQAVKQIKRKMNEINRIFEYVDRLKSELSEGEDLKYKKYTENAFQQIKESAKQLFLKSTKLK